MPQHASRFACPGFDACRFSRRHALKVGGLALLGLHLPTLLRAEDAARRAGTLKPRIKSVIFLFQYGGPSHLDMFDMKPDAPEAIRGPYRPIASNADGIQVSERLPRTAEIMDRVTLIRSVHHTMNNHNSAGYYALTGHAPPVDDQRLRDSIDLHPAYGSVIDKLSPADGEMPSFIAYPHIIRDGSITPGQHASFLGKHHDPFFFTQDPNQPAFALPELTLPLGLSPERLAQRRELQRLIDRQSGLLEASGAARGLDQYYERALGMLGSERLRGAFDLSREPDAVRDAYGRTTYGQSCLLARRLVEHGAKFVTVYFSDTIGGQSTTSGGWDTHGFNNTRMFPIIDQYHLPITEQTLPTLLNDLDTRGLLAETLVLWMGEFGRTPRINSNVSRDHWPHCYTVLLSGAGVKKGYVHGASDREGMYPADQPVRPDDLAATLFHLFGIDPHTEVFGPGDRPLPIAAGNTIEGILT
ncbi:MAG: DUF1501 domain-containing protein [Verrucomicrobiae bacterium]|nr:DUF1501 domain-containing protein [Verrucomicrobiae bacterium]